VTLAGTRPRGEQLGESLVLAIAREGEVAGGRDFEHDVSLEPEDLTMDGPTGRIPHRAGKKGPALAQRSAVPHVVAGDEPTEAKRPRAS